MQWLIGSFIGLVLSVSVSAEPLIEGWVRLASGESVAAAQVRLFDMTDLQRGALARATTDGTGYFALPLASLGGRALPARFALGPNYPNPFNPSTLIPYQLAASSVVRLEVFNLLGQRIATLVDGERPAGSHTATWTATDAAGRAVGAGVYIYRMTVGAASQTGRMVLLDGQAGVSSAGAASAWVGASGGSGADGEQVYGLVVSGEGLAPYVDSSFRVEAGMAPVELIVSSGSGKTTDDDCAFCDLFDALHDDDEGPGPSGKAVATLAAPAAPTNLRFEAVTDSSCTVRWDAAEGAADYDVNYKPAVGGRWTNEPHRGTRLYTTIYDLAPKTEYRWAVRAENRDGASAWVFGPNFTTLQDETDETPEEEKEETPEEEDEALVTIPDANLRAAIAAALGKASGATITKGDMTTLFTLEASDAGISDLTGLEAATNLEWLRLNRNQITDLSPLSDLTNLKLLHLYANNIRKISPLSGLTNLTRLHLGGNQFTGLSPLAGLTNLEDLSLGDGYDFITDVSLLAGLTNLTSLDLSYTAVADISVLSSLTNLTSLNLDSTIYLSDISLVWGMTHLEGLDLGDRSLTDRDIAFLSRFTRLRSLGLEWNDFTDISVLAGLTHLEVLVLSGNNIPDLSPLSGLTNLRWLFLEFCNISDLSLFSGLTHLEGLILNNNNISDIAVLNHSRDDPQMDADRRRTVETRRSEARIVQVI